MNPSEFFGNKKQENPIYKPWSNPLGMDATAVAQKPLPTYQPTQLRDYGRVEEGPGVTLLDKFNRQPIVELAQKAFDSPFVQVPMMAVPAIDLLKGLPLTKFAFNKIKSMGSGFIERQGENISSLGNKILGIEERAGLPTNRLGTKLISYGDDATARGLGYRNYDDFRNDNFRSSIPEAEYNQLSSTYEDLLGEAGIKGELPANNLQEAVNLAWKEPDKLHSFGDFKVGNNSGKQYIIRKNAPANFFEYNYNPESNTVSNLSFSAESGVPFLRHIDELLPSKSTLNLESLSLSGDSSPLFAKLVKWAEKHPEKYIVSEQQVLVPFNNMGKHTELSRLMKMPIEKNNLLGSYFPTYIQKLFGLGGFGLGTNYFDDKNQ